MRDVAIFAAGVAAVLLAGCQSLPKVVNCQTAGQVRDAAVATIQLIDAHCAVPAPAGPREPSERHEP
jgi:outer membrane murein-binding lipoprotein Lpp